MKTFKITTLLIALLVVTSTAFAQSDSFQLLKDNFADGRDVHCLKVSGFLCKTVLWMAGESEVKEAITDLRSVRLITIPKDNFVERNLSVAGFRKKLSRDSFESLVSIKDHGDHVEIYLQQNGNMKDRYLVLVEDASDVTVIEIRGTIDIQKLKALEEKENNKVAYQSI